MSIENKPKSKKKYIILAIIISIPILYFTILTIFDISKTPFFLYGESPREKLNQGYDLVCRGNYGMELCIINHTNTNAMGLHINKSISIEYLVNPCVNVYLENQFSNGTKQITDIYGAVDYEPKCHPALVFKTSDGWTFDKINGTGNDDYGLFSIGRINHNYWWVHFWPLD